MIAAMMVKAALLVGPQVTITGTFKKRFACTVAATGERFTAVREVDTLELRPRAIHLLAAEQALGERLATLGLPQGCVWHTSGLANGCSDLFLSNAGGCVTAVRDTVQNRFGDPALQLAELAELEADNHLLWPDMTDAERFELMSKPRELAYKQAQAERVERLLCARNPYTPTQLQSRYTRVTVPLRMNHRLAGQVQQLIG